MRLLSVPPQIAGRRTRAKVKSGRSHRQRHNCNYFGQPSRLVQLVSCDKFLPEVSRGFGLRTRTPPCGWDRYSGMLQRLCRGSAGCARERDPNSSRMIFFGRLGAVGNASQVDSDPDRTPIQPCYQDHQGLLTFYRSASRRPSAGSTLKREASGNTEDSAVSSRRIAEASIAN
jgi:hypothetical protein